MPLIGTTTLHLATLCPSWADELRLVDATAVPCGRSRETAQRSELAGWANDGYRASQSRWYWGLKRYLISTPEAMPVACCLADPKLGEPEVAAELSGPARESGALPDGRLVPADQGRSGRELAAFTADQIHILQARPDRKGRQTPAASASRPVCANRSKRSMTPSTTSSTSTATAGAPPAGVIMARIAQRLLAPTAAIWHNPKTNAPVQRSLIARDH